ncbi:MAG: sigma-70 family RNA polymerase sigma factor [bacterium]|nr:sigma-70 family RNA polymerase sigma factor [bacterium]
MPENLRDDSYEIITEWISAYQISENDNERDALKTKIVGKMIPVVKKIARRIARRAYDPVEDMEQAGFIGLLKAIDNYSNEKNDNFRAYATYLIISEMKHYLRDKLNTIRVPRYIQELTIRINNFTKDLTPEEINNLTSDEVASALQTSTNAVDMALQVDRRRTIVSLDEMCFANNDKLSFEEILPDGDYKIKDEYKDAKIIFENAINKLPNEERLLVDMYYNQDMTKKEIANALVISPMSVTRRMKQAFDVMSSMIIDESENRELKKGNLKKDSV